MYIIKETKCYLLCSCHDNSYAAGSVLKLKQRSSPPNNLLRRVKNNMEHRVCFEEVTNRDIWLLTERDWSQGCCPHNDTKVITPILYPRHSTTILVLILCSGSFAVQNEDHFRSRTLRLRSNLIWGSFALGPGSFEDFKSLWIICRPVLFDCSF